jgi:hypothetical protein
MSRKHGSGEVGRKIDEPAESVVEFAVEDDLVDDDGDGRRRAEKANGSVQLGK